MAPGGQFQGWHRMMRRGMREVHAWEASAKTYIALYRSLDSEASRAA
jgi:glycogen synthase